MISTVPDKIIEMILRREMEFTDFNFKPETWDDAFVVELLRWYDNKIEIMLDRKRDSSINWYYYWRTYYEQIVRILYYYVKYLGIKNYNKLYKIFRYVFTIDKNDNPYRDSYDMISAEKLMKVYNYLFRKVSNKFNELNIHNKEHVCEGYIAPLVGIWNTEEMKIKLGHHFRINKNDRIYNCNNSDEKTKIDEMILELLKELSI